MSQSIHPTAIVEEGAVLAEDVTIGPWCHVGKDVVIGEGTVLGPSTRIEGPTTIGRENHFYGQASIGTDPQDLKYGGERTELVIGDRNRFREFVSINRGTEGGGGRTVMGNDNFMMVYSHVAHDCIVGSHVVFANGGTLAGHVEVGDHALIGAFTAIHQFCRVGNYAFTGGYTVATQDVLPFIKTVGSRPAKTYGINTIGLERKGFDAESIRALQKAYRLLTRSRLGREEALERIESEVGDDPHVAYLVEFVRGAERGIIR
ncbi:MAG: acyl-ACP--UDP-N-acetylglucosamine O-acyltransferase [Thermoanaerobaculia bacterium]|nr:acyl-ACP--UDP-N-acetylglucosamine O-acyltransferase [Thermoanaerobaculia bacterium]